MFGYGHMMVARLAVSGIFNRNTIFSDPCANNHDIVNPGLARNIRPNPVKGFMVDIAAGIYEMTEVCDVPIIGEGGWNPKGTLNVLCAATWQSNPRLKIKWHSVGQADITFLDLEYTVPFRLQNDIVCNTTYGPELMRRMQE